MGMAVVAVDQGRRLPGRPQPWELRPVALGSQGALLAGAACLLAISALGCTVERTPVTPSPPGVSTVAAIALPAASEHPVRARSDPTACSVCPEQEVIRRREARRSLAAESMASPTAMSAAELAAQEAASPNGTVPPGAPDGAAAPDPMTSQTEMPIAEPSDSALIPGTIHVYQKWNNCGPSAMVMALSALGIRRDQLEVAAELKPDREDTNVAPDELVAYALRQGVMARAAYGGSVGQLRLLVSLGVPAIAEQWIDVAGRGEMGHYRVVVGFDHPAAELIVQDSYYGPLRRYSYQAFEAMWRPFSGAYVVLYPPELEAMVRQAMGPAWDVADSWRRIRDERLRELAVDPNDRWSWFGLGEAASHLGDHAAAVAAFERAIEIGLPFRTFWYQFGYYRSLVATGAYERTIAHADLTLASMKGENLEESHYWRGVALARLGRWPEAEASFAAALAYNPGFDAARRALAGDIP